MKKVHGCTVTRFRTPVIHVHFKGVQLASFGKEKVQNLVAATDPM
jgi:hypothetical protein